MDLWCFKNNLFCLGVVFFSSSPSGLKRDKKQMPCGQPHSGTADESKAREWKEWRRENNVINQRQRHPRSKGLKAAVKVTCCLTWGRETSNRTCSCSQNANPPALERRTPRAPLRYSMIFGGKKTCYLSCRTKGFHSSKQNKAGRIKTYLSEYQCLTKSPRICQCFNHIFNNKMKLFFHFLLQPDKAAPIVNYVNLSRWYTPDRTGSRWGVYY